MAGSAPDRVPPAVSTGPVRLQRRRILQHGSANTVGPASGPVLTLYYRQGCHLCEDLEATLLELLEPASFVLERVDIDDDPALLERFNEDVPVLIHADIELCRHFLDLEAVRQALAGYNSGL